MPFSSFVVLIHKGSFSDVIVIGSVRFCKKIMSEVTSVPALALKALLGSLTAPKNSAFSASNRRAVSLRLSSVPFDVINATTPPGFTISSDLEKK